MSSKQKILDALDALTGVVGALRDAVVEANITDETNVPPSDPPPPPAPTDPVDPPAPVDPVDPDPAPDPDPQPGEPLPDLEHNGITVDFKATPRVARYVTGDPVIEIPSSVVQILPASDAERHGAMVNPPADGRQGWDHRCEAAPYDAALNVDPARTGKPIVFDSIPWGEKRSLVAVESHIDKNRPQLRRAAIFTFVSELPPAGSFRPAYCGRWNTTYNESDINWAAIPSIPAVPGGPKIEDLQRVLHSIYPDNTDGKTGWGTRTVHPTVTLPVGSQGYGRDLCHWIGLLTLFALQEGREADRRWAVLRLLQLGIDNLGAVREGGGWYPNGGHSSGRKWPILFAGKVLGDDEFFSLEDVVFGEDQQTYRAPDGSAEWRLRPGRTDGTGYEFCCTSNVWRAQALGAMLMGLREEWDHEPFFEHVYRYHAERTGVSDSEYQWSPYREWILGHWAAHA